MLGVIIAPLSPDEGLGSAIRQSSWKLRARRPSTFC